MSDLCRSGCNYDGVHGWLAVAGCPVHDPAATAPEPTIPCARCGWDLRLGSKDGGMFLDGATRHMTDFHNLGEGQALVEIRRSEQAVS